LEEYTTALQFNSYTVDGAYNQISTVYMNITNICDVFNCEDFTGCYTGVAAGKIDGTYLDRGCIWTPVSCDDGNPDTTDQCLPPYETIQVSNYPPNCIHVPSNVNTGYCYYYEDWECDTVCYQDSDCDSGGLCFYINYGYCDSGEGEGSYCYWDSTSKKRNPKLTYNRHTYKLHGYVGCSACNFDSDCNGGRCLETIQCSAEFKPFLLEEEISEEASNQRTTEGGLSSVQLGGIIGGCVGFVGILMIVVVVIVRRFHQRKINTETINTIDTLQVPLNQ